MTRADFTKVLLEAMGCRFRRSHNRQMQRGFTV
jgi:hypothetical protein